MRASVTLLMIAVFDCLDSQHWPSVTPLALPDIRAPMQGQRENESTVKVYCEN
ncbi:hypothetical protein Lepto7375DRAFT_7116 [Leptolyngbya sp. PCC 7375]|nr:hypothetical protein Lepto7375DRAFT_7116 [Leptolyngbya sp. PCC 7375]